MNNSLSDPLEELLQAAAHSFRYPPTPDIAGAGRRRLEGRDKSHARRGLQGLQGHSFVWAAALVVLLLLVGLMSVPTVRGAVLDFLQIGVVRIFPDAQFARPTAQPVASPSAQPAGLPTAASTPPFLVYDLVSIFDLDGETSLDEARNAFGVPLRLPSYPPGLGEPERVFLQEMDGSMVVLVWTDPEDPGKARLSLHIIEPGSFAIEKIHPELIQTTQVNGMKPSGQ
jgi:hypothetical protein